jgi:hypothetical protein
MARNSGGPLIGMDGHVIGVNTSGPGDASGVAFVMPSGDGAAARGKSRRLSAGVTGTAIGLGSGL